LPLLPFSLSHCSILTFKGSALWEVGKRSTEKYCKLLFLKSEHVSYELRLKKQLSIKNKILSILYLTARDISMLIDCC
jgi:hypothetical protein